MISLETIRQVCLVVYQAIASVQQQHPELLNEKYRSLPLHQSGYQATFTDRLSAKLSQLSDGQTVVNTVETTLRGLFTPNFFQTSNFQTLVLQVSQILSASPAQPSPQLEEAVEPLPPLVESHSDAIALLLLDAENFQPDIDIEKFLAASCTYPLQVKIAFANWHSLGKKDLEFHNRHYDLMHVPGGKDMADGKIIAVGSSIHEHYPSVQEVVVCSSDLVMTSLCTKLQQRGLVVYQVRKQKDGRVTVVNSKTHEIRTHPNPPAIPPLETCIAQLKEIIRTEQRQSGQAWVLLSKVSQLFHTQYGFTISQVAANHSPGMKARELFLKRPEDFAIHHPPEQEIYVSLFQVCDEITALDSSAPKSVVQEPVSLSTNVSDPTKAKAARPINRITDLEAALVAIVKEATADAAGEYVDIGTVGSHFYRRYQQPITTVLKQLKASKKFPTFLASCKSLKLQQKNKIWQVACTK